MGRRSDMRLLPEQLTIREITERLRGYQPSVGWRHAAACVGVDVEFFYAGDHKPNSPSTTAPDEGRSVCWRCPVRWDCLHDALRVHEQFGVWGGLDAHQRERIRPRHPDAYNEIVGTDSPRRVIGRPRQGRAAAV